ncbi:MAG: hypothetical protein HYU66_12440 [Armatimonadetes bacterium]|nr:hypothetical protein [Armatimonadota bacterium]
MAHLVRSYGYFLFDLGSTLADEVTGNVARVANAIKADMLYFDGSERLQSGPGEHWYDNARLQSLYYAKLSNQDTFLQGSSFSPVSWHLIQRSASADGHGDVKGYLDERTPSFSWLAGNLMPLDCGWYYVYDPEVTADQYDYILQRCLGFDCSISVQTNPANLRTHPDIGAIFDLCNVYERLRLSGRVPDETRAKLREPKREYRLLRQPLRLRRTVFGPWKELNEASSACDAKPLMPGARLGLQLRCGGLQKPGPAYRSDKAVTLETFDDLAPYLRDPQNRFGVYVIGPEGAGSCREGCTQEFASEEGGPEGGRCGRYTATSTRADEGGYTSIGKHFDPPLDLTFHAGIGFWLRGDGQGGSFKLQIRQGPNATDYYIHNDFTAWRYFQLVRPDKPSPLPVDYTKVDYLIFYYNGLPANRTVTCWIDGVKALPALDRAAVTNPVVEAGGRTVGFPATLTDGERLCWFPGEAPYVIPAQAGERRVLPAAPDVLLDPAAPATLRLPADASGALKMRWVQDCPEELPLPEQALATPLPPL